MYFNLIILTGVLVSALCALFCRRTVYALLFLMTTFIMSAFFFLRLEIYFISSILIIVYVGAITMLFLYVVMFLDLTHYARLFWSSERFLIWFSILFWAIVSWFISLTNASSFLLGSCNAYKLVHEFFRDSDILSVSLTLYSFYGDLVLIVGFLLFVVIVIATDIARPSSKRYGN